MNDCYVIDGVCLDSVEAIDDYINQLDEKLKREWGRPLNPDAVTFLYERARENIKCESIRAEIDARLAQPNGTNDEPTEELEKAWAQREEMARQYGYEIETRPTREQRRKLEEVWRKREEEAWRQ
jgi:hypothetical protein